MSYLEDLSVADSTGRLLKYGDFVKRPSMNPDVHGMYVYSRLVNRRGFPVLSYVLSDAGYVLPPDYTCGLLSDLYPIKSLLWSSVDHPPRPSDEDIVVVTIDDLPHPVISLEQWDKRQHERRFTRRLDNGGE